MHCILCFQSKVSSTEIISARSHKSFSHFDQSEDNFSKARRRALLSATQEILSLIYHKQSNAVIISIPLLRWLLCLKEKRATFSLPPHRKLSLLSLQVVGHSILSCRVNSITFNSKRSTLSLFHAAWACNWLEFPGDHESYTPSSGVANGAVYGVFGKLHEPSQRVAWLVQEALPQNQVQQGRLQKAPLP